MSPVALALSPHLDDAAFSAGGTLARLARAGWRVEVATLFTRSVPNPAGFALACQTDKGLAPEVDYMALRRGEDVRAMAALAAAPPRHLPLAEAPHRGYGSAPALFGPLRPDDGARAALADTLRSLLADSRPDLLLAPQGVGGHVDHVLLVRALDEHPPRVPVLWWRDFPYGARESAPAEPFAAGMARRPEIAVDLDREVAAAKSAACLAYASQLGFQFGGPAGLARRLAETGDREVFRLSGTLSGEASDALDAVA